MRWLTGDHYLPGRLTGYFMPWLLVLLLPALLGALLSQRRWLALTVAVPLLLIIVAYAPLFWPLPRPVEAGAATLKVMTYNVWSENRQVAAMARLIRQEQPDIILLQEIRSRQFTELRHVLTETDPDVAYFAYDPQLLQAVISRHPVEQLESLRRRGQAQKVEITTHVGKVTVLNVHPLRQGGWKRRYRQIAALLEEEILPETGAVILAGDFNVNDHSQLYRRVTRHLSDAHRQAGFGFGFTFPSSEVNRFGRLPLPPLIRIDHIFYNEFFTARATRTLAQSGGSDHYPVVTELIPRQLLPEQP
ncbi:MAG: endonuclease/exonuclease/phosphatase family protein [Desulfuromonadales bacterium]|nr:endonuclease/exonuclease/phosphatase family protein [Desulfuromonadales bacterium]